MTTAIREGNEIQDHEILNNTIVEQNSSGMMQFTYPGEDGAPLLTSEWFEASKRSKAIIPWMASVRQRLVEQFQENEAKRKERVAELRKTLPKNPDVVEKHGGDDPGPSPADPIEFARHHYRAAFSRHNQLTRELQALKPELEKWKTVLIALGVPVESEEIDPSTVVGTDSADDGGSGH